MLTKSIKSRAMRDAVIYMLITSLCGIFSAVYEHFSHGVYSSYMVYLFLFPLVAGVLPYLLIHLLELPFPNRAALNLYNSGISSLILGSALSGVFEIYGTQCSLCVVYWIIGIAFTATGILLYITKNLCAPKQA